MYIPVAMSGVNEVRNLFIFICVYIYVIFHFDLYVYVPVAMGGTSEVRNLPSVGVCMHIFT